MTTEQLAEELHKLYRAAFKALHPGLKYSQLNITGHDHGWKGCSKKAYFRRRAKKMEDTLLLEYEDE